MSLLDTLSRRQLLVVTGKGGVGKTAVSAVLGRQLADVIMPARLRSGHTDGLARYRKTGHGPFIGRLIETVAMRADGSEFPVEVALSVAAAQVSVIP